MEITTRAIGYSKGIVLPKSLLAQLGLEGQKTAEIAVENGAIILRKPVATTRSGCPGGPGR